MDKTYIAWNVPNWITVFLMAVIGYALIAMLSKLVMGK